MALTEDSMLLLKVARYYYIDQYSQQEIAEMVDIHRSHVSRILKRARELGYVKIEVSLPEEQNNLGENIRNLLGLERVQIVPNQGASVESDKDALYVYAASFLEKELLKGSKIGIGWGKTLYNIALNLSNTNTERPLSFYSLTGVSGTSHSYLQINTITDRFAHCFGGKAFYNNFSCCLKLDILSDLEKQRLSDLEENWSELDTVIMSLGGYIQSETTYMAELPADTDFQAILNAAQGDILGNFLLENNKSFELPTGYKMTSISLEALKEVPNSICIAVGLDKVRTIINAAKMGYIKTLITDEATGKLIQSLLI